LKDRGLSMLIYRRVAGGSMIKHTAIKLYSASLIFAAAGAFAGNAWAADAQAGKTLFSTKCKTCHGADGTPPAAMAKALGIKPMNDPSVQGKSDATLQDEIVKGVGKMKPQAVSPADAENLVAAIRQMK
jgi:mono/diheme cytochrome c family protein